MSNEASVPAGARVEVGVVEAYRNMKEYLKDNPLVTEAVRRAGGLPTPNLFTGGHDFHSRDEWICVADMGAAFATIVHLAQVWVEETTKGGRRLDASHRHPHPI